MTSHPYLLQPIQLKQRHEMQVQALQTSTLGAGQLSLRSAFSHIIGQEGMWALWKGNGVTVLHRIPYSAINFWAYERLTELWRNHASPEHSSASLDCARRLGAGGIAGGIACAVVSLLLWLAQYAQPFSLTPFQHVIHHIDHLSSGLRS